MTENKQEPQKSDPFSLFGLEPAFFIDMDRLQSKFYEMSRVLHPDRFHGQSPQDLATATRQFARLNEGLRILKSDVERAEYLFLLAHFKPQNSKTALPPDLAEEYFTLQECLEDSDLDENAKKAELDRFKTLITAENKDAQLSLHKIFRDWESAGKHLDDQAFPFFEKAARALNQRAYLKSMTHDLEKKCRT